MKRNFISILDWSREEIRSNIDLARDLKNRAAKGDFPKLLKDCAFAVIFHKNSLRTRVSFEVGISQLGGKTVHLTENDFELGKREPVSDVAKVLSRYVSGILIRTFDHQNVVELGQEADVPVVNMLTDWTHPCQIMADVLTIEEQKGKIDNQ